MEVLLLALCLGLLAATCVLLWMLFARLQRLEGRLAELGSLAFLPDRVQALAKELEALTVDDLRRDLDQLHQDLVRLEDTVSVPLVAATPPSRVQSVRALITRHLREEGYLSVVILSEDVALEQNPAEVEVQAMRRGCQVHGVVQVVDDAIAEVRFDPSYMTFP